MGNNTYYSQRAEALVTAYRFGRGKASKPDPIILLARSLRVPLRLPINVAAFELTDDFYVRALDFFSRLYDARDKALSNPDNTANVQFWVDNLVAPTLKVKDMDFLRITLRQLMGREHELFSHAQYFRDLLIKDIDIAYKIGIRNGIPMPDMLDLRLDRLTRFLKELPGSRVRWEFCNG